MAQSLLAKVSNVGTVRLQTKVEVQQGLGTIVCWMLDACLSVGDKGAIIE
jgi:hypothetical protein